jgi:Ca2+/Na+ antiporter
MMILIVTLTAVILRFGVTILMGSDNKLVAGSAAAIIILVGGLFVLYRMARIIEVTTEVLSRRTKLASGLLQSLGTAFPDMVLGIVAALTSLKYQQTDYNLAISFAVIAASTTFGSNIYNIGYAAWCIFRQNVANSRNKKVAMYPGLPFGGQLTPFAEHKVKPSMKEVDTALDITNALTILTACVALSMVIFGKVTAIPDGFNNGLYQLIRPVGFVIMLMAIFVLYKYRKNAREAEIVVDSMEDKNPFTNTSTLIILLNLLVAGIAILFTAEAMVEAIQKICELTGLATVVAGVAAGLIGCLGEMIVIHNFSVNPKGRIGDAVVGVSMDNIVTLLGACIVAIMGGIFLGGEALIMIFVIIFALNSVLSWQVSKLKNQLPR